MTRILITGGAGFIGSAVARHLIDGTPHHVANVDKLTYAGNLESLTTAASSPRYQFYQVDMCDAVALDLVFAKFKPEAVMHLAAESPCGPLDRRPSRVHPDQHGGHLHAARGRAPVLEWPRR